MTRPTAGHKISDDGNTIFCTAPANAWCRTRPECDTEWWDKDGCAEHDREHGLTPGHDCWAVVWVNAPVRLNWTCADDPDSEIVPGRPVALTWFGDGIGVGWTYLPRAKESA